jgi:methylisocitrate lyase
MTSVRSTFRELVAAQRLLVMPGAYDALSARIIEAEGFQAIAAGGYAAIGSMLAEVDGGQSNMRDYAQHYGRIAGAVSIPVFVDADTGFGGVDNVRHMVRAFEAAGVAAIMIGDQTFPNRCGYLPGKQVVPVEQMLAKIAAAVDARRDPTLVICARTDVLAIEGIEAAIERCNLYLEAGADFAKPQGVDRAGDLARVVREVQCKHIATQSQAAGAHTLSFAELERLGVAAVSLPSLPLFAAAHAVRGALQAVKEAGSVAIGSGRLLPLEDYYALVGLNRQREREQRYDETAAALLAWRKRQSK